MNEPEVIRFVNERLRPRAEQLRALIARIDDDLATWTGQIAARVPNDGTVLEDGRAEEGVSRLTGADLHAEIGILTQLKTRFDANGVRAVIGKACVRAPEIQ
jgi:hypothetical protein